MQYWRLKNLLVKSKTFVLEVETEIHELVL